MMFIVRLLLAVGLLGGGLVWLLVKLAYGLVPEWRDSLVAPLLVGGVSGLIGGGVGCVAFAFWQVRADRVRK